MPNSLKKFLLLLGDLASLHLALFLTLIIRYPAPLRAQNWANQWPRFLVVFLIWLFILYINDLYNLNWRVLSRDFTGRLISAALISGAFSILFFYLEANNNVAPKTNLAIFSVIFLLVFWVWRALYQAVLHSLVQANLAVVGNNQKSAKLLEELRRNPGAGYQPTLIIDQAEKVAGLPGLVGAHSINTIVVCDDFGEGRQLSDVLFRCLSYNLTIYDYRDFYEMLTGKIPVEDLDRDWFLANLHEGHKNYFNFLKQILDFLLAVLVLIISLPFWPLIALIIKLESRGPIFFRQERVGRHEQNFTIIKFRTMREEGNDRALTEAADRRITRFGAFLRQTRIDEIPQVINIIMGDMSFIGPRPERPEIIKELEQQIPFYKTRLLIKPGLTGWDQVSGDYHSATTADSLEKLQYDLYYLKQRSLALDLIITLKTIATVFSRGGR